MVDPEVQGTWVRVCRSIDVVQRRGYRVELDLEHDIALFRLNDHVYAVSNVCPHKREHSIYDGFIDGDTVSCPLHGWCFSIVTGQNTGTGRGLRTYHVEERGQDVWVFVPSGDAEIY